MFAKLIENLIHLKGGCNGFNQHGRLDGAACEPKLGLGHRHDVIPQPGLLVTLNFWEIEIGARTLRQKCTSVVIQVEGHIKNSAGYPTAVDKHVLFIEMPAPWTHQ